MRFIKSIYLFVILSVIINSFLLTALAKGVEDREDYTYLTVGYDSAAENTDVISVTSYQRNKNELTVLQIPRDTYFDHGHGQNKINQLYPSLIAQGTDKSSAMQRLAEEVSLALGVNIDGYIGISTELFVALVDSLGGLDLKLAEDFVIYGSGGIPLKTYSKGINHLNGAQTLEIARYRQGYYNGDLGRLDMQKMLIFAFFDKFKNGLNYSTAVAVASLMKDAVTSVTPLEAISFLVGNLSLMRGAVLRSERLLGNAIIKNGISYFSIDIKASELLIERLFKKTGAFDPQGMFKIPDNLT